MLMYGTLTNVLLRIILIENSAQYFNENYTGIKRKVTIEIVSFIGCYLTINALNLINLVIA